VVISRHPFQQELARQGGADLVLASPKRKDIGEAVRARVLPTTLGGGNLEGGADIVFDCVANTHTFQESLLALRGRGTYVMVGTAGTLGPVDVSSLWFRELRVVGTSCYSFADFRGQRVRTYQKAMEMLAGNYPCEGLLSHVYPLSEFKRAFKTAFDKSRHKSVKVAIDLRTE
jgi:threonine dehydrogenase-like Zn-dependent dehydrogenase